MPDGGSRIAESFRGKTLLITGTSGYLGVVLLEVLLRCCPGVKRIYILLREKKGVSPQNRKADIFKKTIFSKTPVEAQEKVHVIAGDVTLPDLGMSEPDLKKVAREVSIVFHGAASVSFTKSHRYMITHNALAVDYVVELCKKIKNIEVLVYTSTAYSNCNRVGDIEEQVYRLPFPSQRFLNALSGSDHDIQELVSKCAPSWPNTYTFSKCLAENIILEKAQDIPTVIIRPSMVVNCWKGICPGYIQEGSGMVDLALAVGKGFVRVIHADPGTRIDVIPVDIVANAHIVAAWKMVTKRLRHSSPLVVNCVSGDRAIFRFKNYADSLLNMSKQYLIPKSFQRPRVSYQKNALMYWLLSAYEHYAPAYAIDMILRITGKKPRLVSLYRFYDYAMSLLSYFITHEWSFHTHNFESLTDVDPEDKEVFYTDVKGFNVQAMTEVLPKGAPFYQWENDRRDETQRKRVTQMRTMITFLIQWFVLACIFTLFYVLVQMGKRTVDF